LTPAAAANPWRAAPCCVRSKDYVEGAAADFDWYNDWLQILVFDQQDDPALHVRLNPDGTIAEILVRERNCSAKWWSNPKRASSPIGRRRGE